MKRSFKILTYIVLIYLITECLLRVFYSHKLPVYGLRPRFYQEDTVLNYKYRPGVYAHGLEQKDTVNINSYGFIGPELKQKSDTLFRIAIVGDSEVSGMPEYVPYTSLPIELQKIFNDNNWNVEVVNCGVDGAERSVKIFQSVERDVLAIEPDLILLSYNVPFINNDIVRNIYKDYIILYSKGDSVAMNKLKERIDNYEKHALYANFMRSLSGSYVVRFIYKCLIYYSEEIYECSDVDQVAGKNIPEKYLFPIVYKASSAAKNYKYYYSTDTTCIMLADLRTRLNQQNIQFFLFETSEGSYAYQIAKKYSLPFINMKIKYEDDHYYIHDRGHRNIKGNKVAAEKMYEILIKHKLINDKYKLDNDTVAIF